MPHAFALSRPCFAALGLSLLVTACDQGAGPSEPAAGPRDGPAAEAPAPTPDTLRPPSGPSAQPIGVLPLTPGVYVSPDESCARPANAGFRIYDGQGIRGSATRACRLSVVSTQGDDRVVDQSCSDTYSGQRTTTRQTIRINSDSSFTQTEDGDAGTFRLCPAGGAPSYLQDMVTPD